MSWNYRIIAFENITSGEVTLRICETYYDREGKPNGFIECSVVQADLEEGVKSLEKTIKRMKDCLKKPILRAYDVAEYVPRVAKDRTTNKKKNLTVANPKKKPIKKKK